MDRLFIIVICALISLGSSSCRKSDDPLKIVRDYNEAVILAHRTGDTSRLSAVAGEREARVVSVLVATKRGSGLVLEASLEKLNILGTESTGPDALLIETTEQWRYFDRALKPGTSPGQVINATMQVQYDCSRTGAGWKVMQVKVLQNTFLDQQDSDRKK